MNEYIYEEGRFEKCLEAFKLAETEEEKQAIIEEYVLPCFGEGELLHERLRNK